MERIFCHVGRSFKKHLSILCKGLLIVVFQLTNFQVYAQLETGDLAFVGVTADPLGDPVELSIVALSDIGNGETVFITDFPWDGSVLETGAGVDGVISWTTNTEIDAGTLINFSIEGDVVSGGTVSGDILNFGTISVSGWNTSVPVDGSGDSWLIFQGIDNNTPSLFIHGLANWSTSNGTIPGEWRTTGFNDLTTSFLPDDLTLNITAVGLTTSAFHNDNYVYNGTFIGDKTILLSEIGDRSNWTGNDNSRIDITAAGPNFPGIQPIFLVDTPPDVMLSVDNSNVDENGGIANITATVGSTVIFDVVVELAYSGDAVITDDFNAASTITVPANQPSASIQLSVIDDNLEEIDESIIIDIDAITNGNEITPQQVTIQIQDDDFAPIIQNPISDLEIQAGFETLTFDLSTIFSDADDPDLDFTASSSEISVATTSITDNTLTVTENGIGATTISVSANDNGNPLVIDSFVLTILNTAPIATAPAVPIVNEDDIDVPLSDDIQIDDINNDDQTVTFVITGGTVTLGSANIIFGGDGNSSSSFTAQGSLADINTALDEATFTPTPNLSGTSVAGISLISSDGIENSNTASITFSILETNDAPVLTVQSFAYVPNFSDNTVSVIDPVTLSLIETIDVGQGPTGVAVSPDGTSVYITNQTGNSVSVINTTNNTVIATIPVGQDPDGIAVSLDGSQVYVATDVNASINGRVAVIDVLTNTVLGNIDVGGEPTNIFVSLDGERIFVTNRASDVVSVIDALSNMVLSSISVGNAPVDVAASPDGSLLYVTNSLDNTVSVIDVETETEITSIPVSNRPFHLSVSDDASKLYVTNITASLVTVIDTQTNSIITTVDVGVNPNGISISPEGSLIFVTNQTDDNITVIDASDNSVVGTIDVGAGPLGFGNMFARIAISEDDVDKGIPLKFSVSDVDNSILTLSVSSSGGTVSIGTTGITFGGNGNGSDNFTAEGDISDINTALEDLLFSAELNLNGPNAASITISVSDGQDESNIETILISIAPVSDPPTVIADQSFQLEENSANGTLVGTIEDLDPDFGAISQDWTIISGNPNDDGDAEPLFDLDPLTGELLVNDSDDLDFETITNPVEITVTVGDGTNTSIPEIVTINILDVNEAPILSGPNFALDENTVTGALGIFIDVTDPDAGINGDVIFSISGGNISNAFSIDALTGELFVNNSSAFNFEETPIFELEIAATDGGSPALSSTLTIQVPLNDLNDAPTVIDPFDNLILQSGFMTEDIDLSLVFDDEDNDVLMYDAISSNEANATVDITGDILTITEVTNGTSTISVTAMDGNGEMISDDFILIVNASPQLIDPIDDLFLQQGFTSLSIDLDTVFNDGDGNPLIFTANSNNEAIVLADISSNLLILSEVGTGTTTIDLSADDGNGGSVDTQFELVINAQPIASNPIEDLILQSGFISISIDLDTVFSDVDGDEISYLFTNEDDNVAGVSLMDNVITVTEVANGTTNVSITATDGRGGEGNNTFQVVINSAPTIANPLANILEQEGFESTTVDLDNVFTDVDMDILLISVESNNEEVVTTSLNGSILTLAEVGTGIATITVTADDGNEGITENLFLFTVNGSPIVNEEIGSILLFQGFGTETIDISNVFSDPDNNTLAITASNSDSEVVEVELSGNALNISEVGSGSTTITLTADDGNGASVSTSFVIEVDQVLSSIEDQPLELRIFPNPVVNQLTISFSQQSDAILRLLDLSGNEVINRDVSGGSEIQIQMGNLQAGVYLISVEYENGEIVRERIIKN
ncbi:MAG: cadherin domain-containing protein [Bacteroidota bacterium]